MNIFIAATRQNDGKTAVSLGLLSVLQAEFPDIGYIKPVGQVVREVDGDLIDKDAMLMRHIFDLKDPLPEISPVTAPRGFTETFINTGDSDSLKRRLLSAYQGLSERHSHILVEGTGHAGVGSVIDLSNSRVASLLKTKVIIVSSGGIGKPIDEIMLNVATFRQEGVEILGAIINKVHKEKYNKVAPLVRKGLARLGIDTLGVIPFEKTLSFPTVQELQDDLGGELLAKGDYMDNLVEHFVMGDTPIEESVLEDSEGTIFIIPGNRTDLFFTTLGSGAATSGANISGIIATHGQRPSVKVIDVVKRMNIPLILRKENSFQTAVDIDRSIFKLRAEDTEKVKKTEQLIKSFVEVDKIIEVMKSK